MPVLLLWSTSNVYAGYSTCTLQQELSCRLVHFAASANSERAQALPVAEHGREGSRGWTHFQPHIANLTSSGAFATNYTKNTK